MEITWNQLAQMALKNKNISCVDFSEFISELEPYYDKRKFSYEIDPNVFINNNVFIELMNGVRT